MATFHREGSGPGASEGVPSASWPRDTATPRQKPLRPRPCEIPDAPAVTDGTEASGGSRVPACHPHAGLQPSLAPITVSLRTGGWGQDCGKSALSLEGGPGPSRPFFEAGSAGSPSPGPHSLWLGPVVSKDNEWVHMKVGVAARSQRPGGTGRGQLPKRRCSLWGRRTSSAGGNRRKPGECVITPPLPCSGSRWQAARVRPLS